MANLEEEEKDGWVVLLRFQSFEGVVELVDVAVSYTGTLKKDELLAWLEARNSVPPSTRPEKPFRYRWMRDIQQQYERDARRFLVSSFRNSKDVTQADFLAGPEWNKERRRTRGYGEDNYAVVASQVIEIQNRMGNVVEELAEDRMVSYWTAREWITQATKLGLLTRPGKGRRNSRELTPKAITILDDLYAKERLALEESGDQD